MEIRFRMKPHPRLSTFHLFSIESCDSAIAPGIRLKRAQRQSSFFRSCFGRIFIVQSRQSPCHQAVSTSRRRDPRRQDPSRCFPSEPKRVGNSDDWIGEAGWALVFQHNLEPVVSYFPVARGSSCYIPIGFQSNRLLPTPDVGKWRAEKAELCGKVYPEAE